MCTSSGLPRPIRFGGRLVRLQERIAGWLLCRGMGGGAFRMPTVRSAWWGMSYVGVTQMPRGQLPRRRILPEIMPVITGSNYQRELDYQGGTLAHHLTRVWSTYFAADSSTVRPERN